MDNRQRLLEAAGRVYAEVGFRGATTRRIADEAGVNEVTLFRLFGSKAQLLAEAVQCMDPMCKAELPEVPADAYAELVDWCTGHARAMREERALIRRTIGDLDEHPEIGPCVCDGQAPQFRMLVAYATKLASPATPRDVEDVEAACSMLFSALFADAIGRDVNPVAYPQPEGEAPARYVRVFLRSLGVPVAGQSAPNPSSILT